MSSGKSAENGSDDAKFTIAKFIRESGEGGRTPKLTPERTERICKAIAKGHRPEQAALLSGIGKRTFYRWMARGRKVGKNGKPLKADRPYRDFALAIERSVALAEELLLDTVVREVRLDGKLALDLLKYLWARNEKYAATPPPSDDTTHDGKVRIEIVYPTDLKPEGEA